MRWYIVNKEYVSYLRTFDSRVENIDYGNRLKPYLGVILEINDVTYYLPVSSPKAKHLKMKNALDFFKVQDGEENLIAVLNLNNMIPIPDNQLTPLVYDAISEYCEFASDTEENAYVNLLRKELRIINSNAESIRNRAAKLRRTFEEKPDNPFSKRCCDFIILENACKTY